MMRATCVFTTTSYLQRGQAYTHTGLESGWKVSCICNICVLSGATSSDVEIELIDFRSCDFSDTGVSGSRASTGYFINNTSTYSGSWSSNFNVKLTGCRGNGINFPYGGNYNHFNLIDVNNCYFINMVNVGTLGLIQHSWFYGSSGVSFQHLRRIHINFLQVHLLISRVYQVAHSLVAFLEQFYMLIMHHGLNQEKPLRLVVMVI